jgi:hypothetical protein
MNISSYLFTPRAGVDPICSAGDAMRVFAHQVSRPLCHETLVMFIDATGCGQVLVTVSGTTDPFAVVEVADAMATSAARAHHIAGLVLASVRPHGLLMDDDDELWLESCSVVEEAGLVLFDWLLIGHDEVASMCDLLGEPSGWEVLT